jgi:hypothetical protein
MQEADQKGLWKCLVDGCNFTVKYLKDSMKKATLVYDSDGLEEEQEKEEKKETPMEEETKEAPVVPTPPTPTPTPIPTGKEEKKEEDKVEEDEDEEGDDSPSQSEVDEINLKQGGKHLTILSKKASSPPPAEEEEEEEGDDEEKGDEDNKSGPMDLTATHNEEEGEEEEDGEEEEEEDKSATESSESEVEEIERGVKRGPGRPRGSGRGRGRAPVTRGRGRRGRGRGGRGRGRGRAKGKDNGSEREKKEEEEDSSNPHPDYVKVSKAKAMGHTSFNWDTYKDSKDKNQEIYRIRHSLQCMAYPPFEQWMVDEWELPKYKEIKDERERKWRWRSAVQKKVLEFVTAKWQKKTMPSYDTHDTDSFDDVYDHDANLGERRVMFHDIKLLNPETMNYRPEISDAEDLQEPTFPSDDDEPVEEEGKQSTTHSGRKVHTIERFTPSTKAEKKSKKRPKEDEEEEEEGKKKNKKQKINNDVIALLLERINFLSDTQATMMDTMKSLASQTAIAMTKVTELGSRLDAPFAEMTDRIECILKGFGDAYEDREEKVNNAITQMLKKLDDLSASKAPPSSKPVLPLLFSNNTTSKPTPPTAPSKTTPPPAPTKTTTPPAKSIVKKK